MPTTSQIITASTIAVVLGVAGYAIYFDYARRNDPQFRKRLRKEKKRLERSTANLKAASTATSAGKAMPTDAELNAALQVVRGEEVPSTAEEKEQYFIQNLAIGEQLSAQGLMLPAALSFFRAMRVYPEPLQLVMILEKTLPEDTFRIVMDLMSRDVSADTTALSEEAGSSATGRRVKRKAAAGTSNTSPPSETSSQEWDRVTEPDASVASLSSSTA